MAYMRMSKYKRCVALAAAVCILLTGCSGAPGSWLDGLRGIIGAGSSGTADDGTAAQGRDIFSSYYSSYETADAGAIEDLHLRDNKLLYGQYDPASIVTMYLTVSTGNAADGTNHTWEEVNTWSAYDYEAWGVDRYKVNALLQAGDESGPLPGELGYGATVPNATVQIRGQTSSRNAQKNYKIKLRDNQGLWRGQQTIALNKHQMEGIRFRNKLGFDLLSQIPQTMSLRTQFVHLYVKDLTGEHPEAAVFEDYGLYTQVEQPNRKMLRTHGLDVNGDLYKINRMEFYTYDDVIKPANDPGFDQTAFDYLLECKTDSDHSKLIRMLEAVNDYTLSNDDVLDTYVDTENLAYWMAFMILTGNVDTQNRNMYIYSPLNSEKWYILPWDNDGMMARHENELNGRVDGGSWETGISNYWGNMLFRRALQTSSFRKALDDAINDLRSTVLSRENITAMSRMYKEAVRPYVFNMPDIGYLPLTPEEYELITENLADEIDRSYQGYLDSLEKPMPFYMGTPENIDGKLYLNWDIAYDLDAEDIRYNVIVARDYNYEDVIFSQENLRLNDITCPMPEPGQYFYKVQATNHSGYTQDSFDYYVTGNSSKIYGTVCFYVLEDGTIVRDEQTE